MNVRRKNLFRLFVPICFENLFLMLTGMVDTLMLSSVGDNAVGAVGTANTYIGIFIIMFSIISTGMLAVMTQNIGAGRPGVAWQAKQIALMFNAVIGIFMSLFLYAFAGKILEVIGIAGNLNELASMYLKIVGGCCILNALIPVFSAYLRAFSFTKESLVAAIIGNVLNVVLNAVFLFVLHWGVAGVAFATVISRAVNLAIDIVLAAVLIKAKYSPERESAKRVIRQIITVGLPAAMETALYNIAMTLVIRFMNQMDSEGINVTARSYTIQITNFSYCVGAALAQSNAIMTGWRVGAGEFDECSRGVRNASIIGVCVAVLLELIFALSGHWLLSILTDNQEIIDIAVKLLWIDIILECGRVTNMVYGQSLKTSGDAIFPVIMGITFMFLCAVGGTYLFGIKMQLMAVGAYIAMALDECLRGVGMILRWKSGKWKTKSLVRG